MLVCGALVVSFVFLGATLIYGFYFINYSLEFSGLGFNSSGLEFCVVFDGVSCLFIYMLLCCGLMALVYCVHYCGSFSLAYNLYYLMFIFVLVMVFLVMSGNFLSTLVLWEYLGFVSFILILFYSNESSLRSAIITLVSSRFGDVGLFVVLCYWLNSFGCGGVIFSLGVAAVVLSKSACYPLISWLVEAMRAPTPVSSLVHSSTLVAAGVWFSVRYGFVFEALSLWLIYVSSILTVILSGICASGFMDLKKVVAFSTCNNIAWCLVYFACGDIFLVLCQLISHGLCKCLLFMLVGDLMMSSGSGQSSVGVYGVAYMGFWGCFCRMILVFFLCGLPYIGVFFTKHYFFSCYFFGLSWFSLCLVLFGFFLSSVYSFRFFWMLVGGFCGLSDMYYKDFVLGGLSVVFGSVLNYWLCGVMEECYSVGAKAGILMVFLQVVGGVIGWFLCYVHNNIDFYRVICWCSSVFGCDCLVSCFYRFYIFLGGLVVSVLYRWEVWLGFYFVSKGFVSIRGFSGFMFSVGWLGFGVALVIFVCLVFS